MNEIFVVVDMEPTVDHHESEEKVLNETVTEEPSDDNTFGEQARHLTSAINSGDTASDNMTPPLKKKKNQVLYANDAIDSKNPVKKVEDKQPTTPWPLASFPRLDPRVNYPVYPPRPPTGAFEETTPRTLITQPYPYLSHPSSFPHGMPPLVQFPIQKMSTPNYYPQMQTYQQVPPPYYPPCYHTSETNPNTILPPGTIRPSVYTAIAQRIQNMQTLQTPQNMQANEMFFNELANNKKVSAHTETSTSPTTNKYHKSFASSFAKNTTSFAPTISTAPSVPEFNSTGNKISSELKTDRMHTDAKNVQAVMAPVAPDKNKKPDSSVQILPQALVDGAINVASTAYSTAWNALNNLRTTEDKEGVSNKIIRCSAYLMVAYTNA